MLIRHKNIFKKLNLFLIIMAIIMIPISLKAFDGTCNCININTKIYLGKTAELLPGVLPLNIDASRNPYDSTYDPTYDSAYGSVYYMYNKFVGAISKICYFRDIKHIKIVDTIPSNVTKVVISNDDSNLPIYAYYDNDTKTLNLYTEAKKIKLNAESAMLFYEFYNLQDADFLSEVDTSNVRNMSYMFEGCDSLTSLDLSSFDTSKVTNMLAMFNSCTELKTIYVSENFVISNLLECNFMFYRCTSLIGGSGTKYNSNNFDKTYAHIDGGTSNPGYFTAKE